MKSHHRVLPAPPVNAGYQGAIRRQARQAVARQRRGAAVVEFALVAPLFFLLLFGLIEFGRLVMVQQIITNAAREGARAGVLDGSTSTSVDAAVNTYLAAANIKNATTTVTPNPPSSASYTSPVSVTVAVNFNDVSWLPAPLFISGKTLSFNAVMRRETMQ